MKATNAVRKPKSVPTPGALADKVVVLVLTIHAPGNTRKVKEKVLADAENTSWLRVSKKLFDAKEFQNWEFVLAVLGIASENARQNLQQARLANLQQAAMERSQDQAIRRQIMKG